MKTIFRGKNILITGGAGSVGRALTSRLLKYFPKTIRVYDLSENEMFKMKCDLGENRRIRYLMGDIRDTNRLKFAMEEIDFVIHLAAMKHVSACEYNPFEAIKTNIDGLQNVINVARDYNVRKMIFSSTDKAAHPTNIMGMTKLMGEKLIALANYYKGNKRTQFASVRFGNVIGSNGSVIPLFKKQVLSGSAITITHNAMTRFVISMDEAVDLICSAIDLAKGGETFVWKMRTLKVTDLADAMVRICGGRKQIKKVIIGKGHGEKLHEEIMSPDELLRARELNNMYVIFPEIDYLNLASKYKDAKAIKRPVIQSNMGEYMRASQIRFLIEKESRG